ncbi:MAG: Mut7-C RNAse domain-containing protein [Desulfobacterales bacterium]|nr:Mut7-C RNAse domain-containing protein [Desulfobacterales bacterium]
MTTRQTTRRIFDFRIAIVALELAPRTSRALGYDIGIVGEFLRIISSLHGRRPMAARPATFGNGPDRAGRSALTRCPAIIVWSDGRWIDVPKNPALALSMTRMPTVFAAERTLGRLGKWLRLMGFDTLVGNRIPTGRVHAAHRTGKDLSDPDATRHWRVSAGLKTIFIQANDPAEQARRADPPKRLIRPEDLRPFSRCMRLQRADRGRCQGSGSRGRCRITCGIPRPISAPARNAAGCIGREAIPNAALKKLK